MDGQSHVSVDTGDPTNGICSGGLLPVSGEVALAQTLDGQAGLAGDPKRAAKRYGLDDKACKLCREAEGTLYQWSYECPALNNRYQCWMEHVN